MFALCCIRRQRTIYDDPASVKIDYSSVSKFKTYASRSLPRHSAVPSYSVPSEASNKEYIQETPPAPQLEVGLARMTRPKSVGSSSILDAVLNVNDEPAIASQVEASSTLPARVRCSSCAPRLDQTGQHRRGSRAPSKRQTEPVAGVLDRGRPPRRKASQLSLPTEL